MDFSPLFVARVTKAYLGEHSISTAADPLPPADVSLPTSCFQRLADLLRRSKLHTAAAAINKYCATPSLRALAQVSSRASPRLASPRCSRWKADLSPFVSLPSARVRWRGGLHVIARMLG